MSSNVELQDAADNGARLPSRVSPHELFFFQIHHVTLTVESGTGYPGQGGCFYGGRGRCDVSQYRLVFVSDRARETSACQSFSLPLYGIRDWRFDTSFFGAKSWQGHVNCVPGGGLVGSAGFEEFRNHVVPLLEGSRDLHRQFCDLTTPSMLMVPGKSDGQEDSPRRFAYCSAADPFTLYVVKKPSASSV
ncbi:unnamed protein product [Hyaloperonospora brassicae]|uniref:Uncharacterized protein n=1 Tax=Hyaloperonospora brassicae TaxID=162125 RepID=A0AAV0TT40_HYABA|nr:unnamed protein product [Hyaloperonospora brassicae]